MSTTPTLRDAASSHIKQPYTLAEIRAKIASHDYSAEMLLQHAMLLLEGAGAVEPVAWREAWRAHGGKFHGPYVETGYMPESQLGPFLASITQQAVAREREECAAICERAVDSIWEYHEDNHKRTGRNVCTNLAAAIRAKGTHD